MLMSHETTKWFSFVSAILNVLVAGTIAVFALYAPQLQRHLHYTSLQVNSIGIACQLGLYLTVPFLGYLCDRKGPRIVAAWAAVVSLPAYAVASLAYTNQWRPWILVVCYAFLGSATVALYLSGLSTVAKNHPRSRGLGMAVVTASFGLSGLWETQVVDHFYRNAQGEIRIQAMYLSFGTMLSATAILSSFSLRIVNLPLQGHSRHNSSTSRHAASSVDSDSCNVSEETGLLAESAILEPSDKLSATDRLKVFLKDHSSWWYFLAFILLAGPGEVYTNNLGAMYQSLRDAYLPRQVASSSTQLSIFALSSTLGRLVFGTLCDLSSKSPITARMIILIMAASLLTFGFMFLSFFSNTSTFWVSATCIGAGYGGLFTVYPLIISIVWGNDSFATFWGCLATAPAVGSTFFGVLYATWYDHTANKQHSGAKPVGATKNGSVADELCVGRDCFKASTACFAVSNAFGVLILLFALRVWRRRFAIEY